MMVEELVRLREALKVGNLLSPVRHLIPKGPGAQMLIPGALGSVFYPHGPSRPNFHPSSP